MGKKICRLCGKEFNVTGSKKRQEKRIFCSSHCSGKSNAKAVIERNKARRKYPEIEGLSRQQVFYRYNPNLKANKSDKEKREKIIRYLGAKCVKCQYDKDIRALVLDHKNGDGEKDRKEKGSKIQRYYILHLEEAKNNLQVLCANCNVIKAIENNEHNRSRRIKKFY